MPQSLFTGQLKEKPTYRFWCLYSSFVHDVTTRYTHPWTISLPYHIPWGGGGARERGGGVSGLKSDTDGPVRAYLELYAMNNTQ